MLITEQEYLIAKKPFPRIGMKKNQGITTLNKPNLIPSKKDAVKISYFIKIKKTNEYITATV